MMKIELVTNQTPFMSQEDRLVIKEIKNSKCKIKIIDTKKNG